uniref:Uncharacterized protein n=1 Tax=Arundo donax TaxID=35708 RepID=A0A0A9E9R3_ARUDO
MLQRHGKSGRNDAPPLHHDLLHPCLCNGRAVGILGCCNCGREERRN